VLENQEVFTLCDIFEAKEDIGLDWKNDVHIELWETPDTKIGQIVKYHFKNNSNIIYENHNNYPNLEYSELIANISNIFIRAQFQYIFNTLDFRFFGKTYSRPRNLNMSSSFLNLCFTNSPLCSPSIYLSPYSLKLNPLFKA